MINSKKNTRTSQRCEKNGNLMNISEAEWQRAIKQLIVFLRWKMRNLSRNGAFSEAVLGMPAVDYFRSEACYKLLSGAWRWDPKRSLAGQLIRIADNLISKQAKHYVSKPQTETLDSRDDQPVADGERELTDAAYAIAFERVRGIKELEKYLKAVREYNDYKEISIHLHITLKQVYQLQKRLLEKVQREG